MEVYNLEVEGAHTYFVLAEDATADADAAWAHNADYSGSASERQLHRIRAAIEAKYPGGVHGTNMPYRFTGPTGVPMSGDFDIVTNPMVLRAFAIELKQGSGARNVRRAVEQSLRNAEAAWLQSPTGVPSQYAVYGPDLRPELVDAYRAANINVVKEFGMLLDLIGPRS